MTKKIIFSAGGTGGHIFPAINLMKHFSDKGYQVLLITDYRGNKFLDNFPDLKFHIIKADTPLKKNFFRKIFSFFVVSSSIIKSIFILKKEKPNLIFGLGGYASFPISLASKFLNLPLVIYENNVVLGRTNKYLLPFSKKIFLSTNTPVNFPKKYEKKICKVGPILKKDIINYVDLKKETNNFNILVLGGSQGAEIFGKIIPPTIKMIKDKGYNIKIIQQCVQSQRETLSKFYETENISNNVFVFKKNILELLSLADIAISRCGASTTAELVQTNTPFIAVPLSYSIDNHQYLNARYHEKNGCCWLLEQKNFNSSNLFNLIIGVLQDKKKLENVKESMKKNVISNVYNNIENKINEFI